MYSHRRLTITLDIHNAVHYHSHVIASFADPETERLFHGNNSRRLPPDTQRRAHRKLLMLHAVISLQELMTPRSNRLEALKGNRDGLHSIRINDQWRICFRWQANTALDVEIVDYH